VELVTAMKYKLEPCLCDLFGQCPNLCEHNDTGNESSNTTKHHKFCLTVSSGLPAIRQSWKRTPQDYSAESVGLHEKKRVAEPTHRGIKAIILTAGGNTNPLPNAGFYLRTG
jgi:hypothetical protein